MQKGHPKPGVYGRMDSRLLLKHRSDDCKFFRYRNKEMPPDSQQSSFRWISSGGDRGEQAVLRTTHNATIQAGFGSGPWWCRFLERDG